MKCDPEETHRGFNDTDAVPPFNMNCRLNDLRDVKM